MRVEQSTNLLFIYLERPCDALDILPPSSPGKAQPLRLSRAWRDNIFSFARWRGFRKILSIIDACENASSNASLAYASASSKSSPCITTSGGSRQVTT